MTARVLEERICTTCSGPLDRWSELDQHDREHHPRCLSTPIDSAAVRDFYEECAGTIEFDGGLSRSGAERQALAETAAEFGLTVDDARRLISEAGYE
jgi:hypothetical protein